MQAQCNEVRGPHSKRGSFVFLREDSINNSMEDTLINKVERIEKEVTDRTAQVQQERKEQLADLKVAEGKVMDDIRRQAETKGQEIVNRLIEQVKNEINQMKQDRENAVKAIHEQAEKNMTNAMIKTVSMFEEMYLEN